MFMPGGKKLLLFRTFTVRHSGAGQPRVRNGSALRGKQMAELRFYEFTEYDRPMQRI